MTRMTLMGGHETIEHEMKSMKNYDQCQWCDSQSIPNLLHVPSALARFAHHNITAILSRSKLYSCSLLPFIIVVSGGGGGGRYLTRYRN